MEGKGDKPEYRWSGCPPAWGCSVCRQQDRPTGPAALAQLGPQPSLPLPPHWLTATILLRTTLWSCPPEGRVPVRPHLQRRGSWWQPESHCRESPDLPHAVEAVVQGAADVKCQGLGTSSVIQQPLGESSREGGRESTSWSLSSPQDGSVVGKSRLALLKKKSTLSDFLLPRTKTLELFCTVNHTCSLKVRSTDSNVLQKL